MLKKFNTYFSIFLTFLLVVFIISGGFFFSASKEVAVANTPPPPVRSDGAEGMEKAVSYEEIFYKQQLALPFHFWIVPQFTLLADCKTEHDEVPIPVFFLLVGQLFLLVGIYAGVQYFRKKDYYYLKVMNTCLVVFFVYPFVLSYVIKELELLEYCGF